ncbi:MAG TPA: glycosyl hydrolase [Puia sp.]|nr:glycosyl hydrolase [Puia sp.]
MKGQMALDLEKGFRHPPDAAKPWVFWYWMQGAVSKEGIRADLQAMKEQGIGGAYLMPINDVAKPPLYTPVVRQLSPAWWQMVRYAMKEADSLGLQLAMHACDGFAVAGGPWITPELSMQKVVWSRSVIEGGRQIETVLPQPETHEKYYKDLAILAFPTPANWEGSTRTTIPQVTTSSGATAQYLVQEGNKESFKSEDACWIQYTFDHPFTCRTIIIHSTNNYQSQRLLVQVSDDGINFRPAGRLTPPRHGWEDGDAPVTHTIPAVTARYFRLVYDKTGSEPGAEDLDAAKWKPSLKVSGIELSAMPSIGGIEGKSGVVWRISERSTAAQLPDSSCVDPHTMIDLTHRTDAQGRLTWKAPAGHWTLLRIGHTSTGHTNETGGGGKGLECDKFNPRAVNLQFDRWFGETIRQAGPELASRVLKIFHVDSWECGSQNWSPVFREEFKRRRGYDPLRWLPVMAGIPLASADSSENFLKDIRQTITELIHDNFFAVLAQRAHAKGCSFSAESVAPTMTSDGMLHYSEADIPMGEFWLRSPTHDKPNDILDAISGAHIYGKTLVQAEAFTELREAWDEYPGLLKTLQDRNYALGINRLVFHVFTHNPWTDRKPGMTLGGVGTFLQRDQTWWAQSSAWITYTQRCQWLLQQGSAVADIAVFTGEEIPRRALLPERLVTTLPGLFGKARVASEQLRLQNTGEPTTKFPNGVVHAANMSDPAAWIDPLHGYAYDCLNPDVLLHRTSVDKGHIVLPEGARYSILVIPCSIQDRMSPEVTARLQQLVQAGATILIKGEDPAGQSDQPLPDQSFREVKDKNGYSFLEARVGEGKVIRAPFRASSLEGIGIEKDFSAMESDYRWNAGAAKDDTASEIVVPALHPATGIAYTHRTAPGFDIYFVSNQQDRQRIVNLSLRISGRKPEIWDAVTGEITPAGQWSQHGGHTVLPVHLDANGSLFLVFRQPSFTAGGVETNDEGDNYTEPAPVQTLHAPWTLHFDTAAGGPAAGLVLDSLEDWSRNADSAIRYYSGTAAYQQSFQWDQPTKDQPMKDQPARDQPADGRLWLDLGRVNNIARVTLNGVDCGIAWTPPYRVEITRAIKKGNNTLKIEVTNTWANRLTGDHLLPENKRATWTTSPYHLDGKLLPAGLLGPVLIVR